MEINELSPAQRQYLQQLNARLITLERHVKQEALALIAQLEARVQDPQDRLCDYEIELQVHCWLRKDDPAYCDEDDNVLAMLRDDLKLQLRFPPEDWGLDDGRNHNDFQDTDGHPFQGEFHCWLYRCVYHRTDLWFDPSLRMIDTRSWR
jgi:hypothetical protein